MENIFGYIICFTSTLKEKVGVEHNLPPPPPLIPLSDVGNFSINGFLPLTAVERLTVVRGT